MSTRIAPAPFLKNALRLDASASGAMAVLQLSLGATLAPLLQLPAALLFETGIFLVVFAATLLLMASSARLPAALVRLIIVGNVGWALASAALALWLAPGALGLAYLAVNALAVLLFAALEQIGLRRSAVAMGAGPALAR